MAEHVLVIFPHPDDEAFSCTGTVLSYSQRGIPVTYICLTLGEMGRNMGNPNFANRETLPSIRKKELERSCQILGIQNLELWGLRDKTVEFEVDLDKRMFEAIKRIKPTLIITFYPGYSVHPDHDATGKAVFDAVNLLPPSERPVVYGVAFAKNSLEDLGEPDVVLDVSRYQGEKMAVLEAHASQAEGMLTRVTKQKDPEILKRMTTENFWIKKPR